MFKNRVKLVITILTILSLSLLLRSLGLFSKYNYFTAKLDIHKNLYQIILIDEDPDIIEHEKWLGVNHGYDIINIQTSYYWSNKLNAKHGVEMYNKQMVNAIKKQMNAMQLEHYKNDVDSISSEINKYPRF